MIWQGRGKLGLIIALALFMFSCEEPSEIGLELDPDKNKVGLFYKEITIPAVTINTDSLETDFSDRILSGVYRDDNFGEVICTGISQVRQGLSVPNFPDSAIFDSLIFMMELDYTFGPDIGQPQKYFLYRLEEQLTDTISYYAKSHVEYGDQPIGENQFVIDPDIDTVLSITLNDDFGQEFFNVVTDTSKIDWSDADNFVEYFRGLALVADDANNSTIGFPVAADSTILRVVYHDDNDTSHYDFILKTMVNFNQIISDKSGSVLAPIEGKYYEDFLPVDGSSYLQAGSGVLIKLDMEPLTSFMDTIPNLIVNSSVLEVSIESTAVNINPPDNLNLYLTDSTNRRITSGLVYLGLTQAGSSELLELSYDPDDFMGYKQFITVYTEDLARGSHTHVDLLLYPVESELTQSINNFKVPLDGIKVKMYYTALK